MVVQRELYDIAEIEEAISNEVDVTPKHFDFKVSKSEKDRELWKITIDPSVVYADGKISNIVLDDSLEGSCAWWSGPPKGTGDVLTLVPEDDKIIIRYATSEPPKNGGLLRIYPPNYLEAILSIWNDFEWAKKAIIFEKTIRETKKIHDFPLSSETFTWLRTRQKSSFNLSQYQDGFLWGPPGTGKTTTIGVFLAEYLVSKPTAKALLFSTTNHAVDQVTVSVDKALEQARHNNLRKKIFRIGNRFIATNYKDREHLIPVSDQSLTIELSNLEAERPPSSNIHYYNDWKRRVESLRQIIRNQSNQVLSNARLASMTTTRAAFDFLNLKNNGPYDLVVFDEASQVSLAHALALSPLGKQRIFAGDPKQLSPIVRSTSINSMKWLGKSIFSLMPTKNENTCFLNEQSRMASPICKLISQVFYNGELVVAKDCDANPTWKNSRKFKVGPSSKDCHVFIERVEEDGVWSAKFKGPIRYKSAEAIVSYINNGMLNKDFRQDQIVVLTPFRAQRALITLKLSRAGLKKIRVSTVHRAQGSESPIVFFDPAQGNNKFLLGEEARRLINVALSRAEGKVILMLSKGDLENRLFQEVANIVNLSTKNNDFAPIYCFFDHFDFPHCIVGKSVQIFSNFGVVESISSDGERVSLINANTGKRQEFIIETMKRNLSDFR